MVLSLSELSTGLADFKAKFKAFKAQSFINADINAQVMWEKSVEKLEAMVNDDDLVVRFPIDAILGAALLTDDGDGDRGTDKAIEQITGLQVETLKAGTYAIHTTAASLAAVTAPNAIYLRLTIGS